MTEAVYSNNISENWNAIRTRIRKQYRFIKACRTHRETKKFRYISERIFQRTCDIILVYKVSMSFICFCLGLKANLHKFCELHQLSKWYSMIYFTGRPLCFVLESFYFEMLTFHPFPFITPNYPTISIISFCLMKGLFSHCKTHNSFCPYRENILKPAQCTSTKYLFSSKMTS